MPVDGVSIDSIRLVCVEDHLPEPPPVTTTIFCASEKSPNMMFSVSAKKSMTESDEKVEQDPPQTTALDCGVEGYSEDRALTSPVVG